MLRRLLRVQERLLQHSQGSSSNTVLRAADGKGRITSTKEKLERWRRHFEQVTNVVSEVTEATLSMIPVCVHGEDLEVSDEVLIQEPSEDEVREAILQLKNNKAPGDDGITAELLKLGGETIVEEMTRIAVSIWRSERIPEDWLMQITIPVYKKGAHDICDNFRGIALLSVPGKVLCRIIYNGLKERAELMLRENQRGFQEGRGCVDQVYNLRVLMEKAREFHSPLYLCFIDLKKAYDSVNREALWATLRKRYGIPSKLVHILASLHEGTKGVVRAYGKVSDEFPIMNGIRQGDILAPTLFNLFFDAVIDMAVSKHPGHGVKMWFNTDAMLVGSRKKMKECVMIQDLEYADDMCLISDNMDELEMMLQDMNESCSEMGLTISTKKSKIMAVLPSLGADNPQQLPRPVQIQLLSDPVSVVSDFEYLGSIITSDCNNGQRN